jgi:hypothetical protein
MDTNRILTELRAERDRIGQAIAAIEAVNSTGRRRVGRPPKAARKVRRRGRMSAAARRKLSRRSRSCFESAASSPTLRRERGL